MPEPYPHDLYPLCMICAYDGIALPPYRVISAAELPAPYDGLLNHTRDMTSVLQEYHGQSIHLENVSIRRFWNHVVRKVALVTEDGRSVEFGAIEISLAPFPQVARWKILACIMPLGAILHRYGIGYKSKPRGFVEIESNSLINDALKLDGPARLYGRMNVLRSTNDEVLARVIEILPPTQDEA